MFENWAIGKKIGLGFTVVLGLTFSVGMVGYYALNRVMEGVTLTHQIHQVQSLFGEVKLHTDQYQLARYAAGEDAQETAQTAAFHYLSECASALLQLTTMPPTTDQVRPWLAQAQTSIENYKNSFRQYVSSETTKQQTASELQTIGADLTQLVDSGEFLIASMQTANKILLNDTSVYFVKNTEVRWLRIELAMANMQKAINHWYANIESSESLRPIGDKIKQQFTTFQQYVEQYHVAVLAQKRSREQMQTNRDDFNAILTNLLDATNAQMQVIETLAIWSIFGFMGIALIAGALFSLISTHRWIIHPILALTDVSQKLAQGEWNHALPIERADEIGSLAKSFAHMRDEIFKNIEELSETNQALSQANIRISLLLQGTRQLTLANDKFTAMRYAIVTLSEKIQLLPGAHAHMMFGETLVSGEPGYSYFHFPMKGHTDLLAERIPNIDHAFLKMLPAPLKEKANGHCSVAQGALYVPIQIREDILGFIQLENIEENAFTVEDQEFTETLSYSLAVALESIQHTLNLEQQVQERTEQLKHSLQELEQQNTTLLVSNRKLEDLNHTKEHLLKQLSTMQTTQLHAINTHLELLKATAKIELQEPVRQITREIYQIEEILRPVTSLYLSEQAIQSKRVLLAETDKKQQIIAKMALGGTGVELDIVSSMEEGQTALKDKPYDILCTNRELIELSRVAIEQTPDILTVFMTSESGSVYLPLLQEYPFLSNIISRNDEDRTFTLKNISTTVSKLITQDFFGLEKYLNWGIDVQQHPVVTSQTRNILVEKMEAYFKQLGIRRTTINRAGMVAEELLMNAIYDAPVDSEGKSLYNHLPRTENVELSKEEQSILRYACDGVLLAVSVEDPFGAFHRETILKYLESCYSGQAGSLQQGKGGAGRGLFQIMTTAELVVFNVKSKIRTEVIAIFNVLPNPSKTTKTTSFHYFYG